MTKRLWAVACSKNLMTKLGLRFSLLIFRVMRASACLAWALYGVVTGVMIAYAQDTRQDIVNENRLTKVETRIEQIWEEVKTTRADLKDSTKLNYIAVFGTSGLLGEMGIRLMLRKKKKGDDDGEAA